MDDYIYIYNERERLKDEERERLIDLMVYQQIKGYLMTNFSTDRDELRS